MSTPNSQGYMVLVAASIVSMVLGSIHAFSVFLEPLEAMYEASRATVSLVYSFSLVFLTLAVLFGPSLYSRVQPKTIYIWVALLGGAGAIVAGIGGNLAAVFIGYSLIFGLANGLGYGFGLQFAARANPQRAGFAMGIVTAAYALGAVLAPLGFEAAMIMGGFYWAMIMLGTVVFVAAILAAVLVARSGMQYSRPISANTISALPWSRIPTIWFAYGSGVAAGLMAIGHTAAIAASAGFAGWIAVSVIAACNLVGSLLSGWLSDRFPHRVILTLLPLFGATALIALTVLPDLTIILLGTVGFAYGGIIATYPAAVAHLFTGEDGPRAYGRIFTAWGTAGLFAPWIAGQIFDWGGSYAPALWLAAGLGIVSAIIARNSINKSIVSA